MSFTLVEQAPARLNRSELAVPGSRTELFEKAAASKVDMIFLDLRRDRYVLMTDARRAAFDRLLAGKPNDSDAMTLLVDTGLFVRGDFGFRIEAPAIDVPTDDLSRPDSERSGLRSLFGAWRALAWAARALKPDRLPSTIEQLLRDKRLLDRSGHESEL